MKMVLLCSDAEYSSDVGHSHLAPFTNDDIDAALERLRASSCIVHAKGANKKRGFQLSHRFTKQFDTKYPNDVFNNSSSAALLKQNCVMVACVCSFTAIR